jgi:hypothetical protein
MGLRDFYYKMEEKYYKVLDKIDKVGIPIYKVTDPIDKVIPSFAIVLILMLIVVLGIVYAIAASAGIFPDAHEIIVTVQDADDLPLLGAVVSISFDDVVKQEIVNASGAIRFEAPVDQLVTFDVEYNDETYRKTLMITEASNYNLKLDEIATSVETISFSLLSSDNSMLSPVNIYFECSNRDTLPPEPIYSYSDSDVIVDVPKDCGVLTVNVESDNYNEGSWSISNGGTILLQPATFSGNSTIFVNIKDNAGNLLEDVDLTLVLMPLDQPIEQINGASSFHTFSGLAPNQYKVVGSKDGYTAASQLVYITFDGANEEISLELVPGSESINSAELVIKVLSCSSRSILSNATVCLYHSDNGTQGDMIACQEIDSEDNGLANFTVADKDLKYHVAVKKSDYRSSFESEVEVDDGVVPICLVRRTSDNENTLKVKVVDQDNDPVYNARVYLYDDKNNMMELGHILTDFNGVTSNYSDKRGFFVDDGKFQAYAYKGLYSGKSVFFDFDPDGLEEEYDVLVTLTIPDSALHLIIRDKFGDPVPNAIVKLYDAYASNPIEIGQLHSDPDGTFQIAGLKADKKVYYTIEKEGFERYVSLARFLPADSEFIEEVILDKPSLDKMPSVEILGLFDEDDKVAAKVSASNLYKLKFKITLPSAPRIEYETMHMNLLVGDSDIVEKEFFYIENISRSALATLQKADEFDLDTFDDSTRTISNELEGLAFKDEIQFAQLTWRLGENNLDLSEGGVFYVDAYLRMKDFVPENEQLELQYYLDVKRDKEGHEEEIYLPEGQTNPELGGYYNTYKPYLFFAGNGQQICDGDFCFEASVTDQDDELISDLLSDTPFIATIGTSYGLDFTIINKGDKPLTRYRLIVENPEENLYFDSYDLKNITTDQAQRDFAANTNAEDHHLITHRGEERLGINDALRGLIDFVANEEGNGRFNFKIIEDNRIIYEKEYYLTITADKEIKVELEPEVIPSYVAVTLKFEVTDFETGRDLNDATVYITDVYDTILAKRQTENGKIDITLQGQPPNVNLYIKVFKKGYKPFAKEFLTSSEFVKIEPEELNTKIDVTDRRSSETLKLTNTSEIPVEIGDLELEGNFDEYISVSQINQYLRDSFTGQIIDKEHSFDMPVIFSLTQMAQYLTENREYEGTLKLPIENGIGAVWLYEVPVKIYISLGKSLDSLGCLILDTKETQLVSTSGKIANDLLTVTNSCTVEGKPVTLQNLEMKIEWKDNSLGSFEIDKDNRKARLQQAYYISLGSEMDPESEETFAVHLLPRSGRVMGTGQATLYVRAGYFSENGLQFVENKVDYDVDVVNMESCIGFELPDGETDLIKVLRDQEGSFKVKSTCETEVDMKLTTIPEDFVEVTPKDFTLRPDSEQMVKVKPKDSPVGVYLLEARGKTPGHTYEALRAGIGALRLFVAPLESDCIIMDNYEFDIYDTADSGEDESYRYGYVINRCYKTNIKAQYPLKIKAPDFGDIMKSAQFWISTTSSMVSHGIAGYFAGDAYEEKRKEEFDDKMGKVDWSTVTKTDLEKLQSEYDSSTFGLNVEESMTSRKAANTKAQADLQAQINDSTTTEIAKIALGKQLTALKSERENIDARSKELEDARAKEAAAKSSEPATAS